MIMLIMVIMTIIINNNNNNNNNNNHKHKIKIKKYCQIIKNTLKTGKNTWDNAQVIHSQKKLKD